MSGIREKERQREMSQGWHEGLLAEQLNELPCTQVGKTTCGEGMKKSIRSPISDLTSLRYSTGDQREMSRRQIAGLKLRRETWAGDTHLDIILNIQDSNSHEKEDWGLSRGTCQCVKGRGWGEASQTDCDRWTRKAGEARWGRKILKAKWGKCWEAGSSLLSEALLVGWIKQGLRNYGWIY